MFGNTYWFKNKANIKLQNVHVFICQYYRSNYILHVFLNCEWTLVWQKSILKNTLVKVKATSFHDLEQKQTNEHNITKSDIIVKNIVWLYILVREMKCMPSNEISAGEKERGSESKSESQKGR